MLNGWKSDKFPPQTKEKENKSLEAVVRLTMSKYTQSKGIETAFLATTKSAREHWYLFDLFLIWLLFEYIL